MRESADGIFNNLIIIRGAGDLATAVAIRLHNSGFRVVCLEVAKPTVIRRTVSFAQAVFEGQACVENVRAQLVSLDDIDKAFSKDFVPVLILHLLTPPQCYCPNIEIYPQPISTAIRLLICV